MNPLYTIGHSTHDLPKFLTLLKQHGIEVVADVRSRPHSRFPWFCQASLEKELKLDGVRYVFLGKELGARREEPECYIGLPADYELISGTQAYQRGLERIKAGSGKYRIALMCSEREPLDCHRTILVCRHAKTFAEIYHIHADGHLESHEDAEARMLSRYDAPGQDLFRSRLQQLEEAYKRRGREINYVEQPNTDIVKEETLTDEY